MTGGGGHSPMSPLWLRPWLGSRNLHHRVAPDSSFLTLNFTMQFQREDTERGRQIREGYEKYAIFSQYNSPYLRNGAR